MAPTARTRWTRRAAVALIAGLGALPVVAAPLVPASAQSSLVVYAEPSGTGTACVSSAPCPLAVALGELTDGGTLELSAGPYVVTSPLSLTASGSVTIIGDAHGSRLVGSQSSGPLLTISDPAGVTIESVTVSDATDGALQLQGGNLALSDDTFSDDGVLGAAPVAGAVDVAASAGQSQLTVEGSTFFDDRGAAAGAIGLFGGSANVEGSTFADDLAVAGAGAIGGTVVASLAADLVADDGSAACGGGDSVASDVVAVATICGAAPVASSAAVFPTGKPVLAANGGAVATVEVVAGSADAAAVAVPANAPSIVEASATFCSLPDARGVSRPGGAPCATGAVQPDPPTISSLSPASGKPGDTVTVSGSGLALVRTASLDGTALAAHVASDTSLSFVVPTGLADLATTLVVTSPDGSASAPFTTTGPFVISTTTVPTTELGSTYFFQLVASGGSGGNRWSVTPLPDGITLGRGILSGHPLAVGDDKMSVSVTDSAGAKASATIDFVVAPGPTVTTTALPGGEVGKGYATVLRASGGAPPYRWSVVGRSSLPGGMLLTSGGLLSGRPGSAGTTLVEVQVSDALGGIGTATFPFVVKVPPPPPERFGLLTIGGHFTSYGSTAVALVSPPPPGRFSAAAADPNGSGYWLLGARGAVVGVAGAHSLGSVGKVGHAARLVGIAPDPSGTGYWVVDAKGRVFGFGTAHAFADSAASTPSAPVVAISRDPTGVGYWLLEDSGKVDAYGAAAADGSVPAGLHVHAVGIAATADGRGYFVLTAGGRVFAFGDARSLGDERSYKAGDYTAIASAPTGIGYWIVTSKATIIEAGTARDLPEQVAPPRTNVIAIAAGP